MMMLNKVCAHAITRGVHDCAHASVPCMSADKPTHRCSCISRSPLTCCLCSLSVLRHTPHPRSCHLSPYLSSYLMCMRVHMPHRPLHRPMRVHMPHRLSFSNDSHIRFLPTLFSPLVCLHVAILVPVSSVPAQRSCPAAITWRIRMPPTTLRRQCRGRMCK